jgi:predicted transposase YbfD/YdcC
MNTTFDSPADLPPSSIIACFRDLPDPRVDRTRDHELGDILVIGLCTLLGGGETFADMERFGQAQENWLRTFLRLPCGIPSHDTFNRVFSALDPKAFGDCFLRWTQSVRQAIDEEIVALDGKALRRALKTKLVPYMVNAWAADNGLVLGQVKVEEKSNEITAVPDLLRALELAGCIVTLDAMGCQKKIAREIRDADADYVLALKGNQESVHAEVKTFLDDAVQHDPTALASYETVEKDHGRIEIRRYWQTSRLDWFADLPKWEGLASIGMVESERRIPGKEIQIERRYFLSSLTVEPKRFARAVRGHWSIENNLHWVLDVQFGEDQSRARTGYADQNLALLRRLALNVLKRDTLRDRSLKGRQKRAAWNPAYRLRLLGLSVTLDKPQEPVEPPGA